MTVELASGRRGTFHRRKWDHPFECRKRSPADQIQEDYAAALEAWKSTRPRRKAISARAHDARASISINMARDDASNLDEIEADLALVREWLSRRPAKPLEP